jgi:3-mercaptopropionate dioxygenase
MNTQRFTQFLDTMDALVTRTVHEPTVLDEGEAALKLLIARDDWLPSEYAVPVAERYQSYALYVDPQARYSVISFVWAPGQGTPIHNHTVWGLVGVLRGAERCEEFPVPGSAEVVCVHDHILPRGDVDRVSPALGDWHKVSNAMADQASVSIHVYGADIGRVHRSFWDVAAHELKPMVSGYSNDKPWIAAR